MSDTRYTRRTGPGGFGDPDHARPRADGPPAHDDPLAELARLIDEDPFEDYSRRRQEPPLGAPPASDPYVPESGGDYQEPYAAPSVGTDPRTGSEYDEPRFDEYDDIPEVAPADEPEYDPTPDDDLRAADTERLYASLAAASRRVEPSPPPRAAEPDIIRAEVSPVRSRPDFDPAAALEASLLGARGAPRAEPDDGAFFSAVRASRQTSDGDPGGYGDAGYEDYYAESEPVFDDSGHIAPYDGDLPERSSGRRRGAMIVAGLLGLVVVGGGAALAYRTLTGGEADGPPPVIRAEKEPAKLMPEKSDAEGGQAQGKLVYDRVGGNSSSDEATLVPRTEPLANIAPGRQVRVVDPNNEEASGLRGPSGGEAEDGTPTATAPVGESVPKRVRTVVVKPDGTIVGEVEPPKAPAPVQSATQPSSALPTPAPLAPAPLQAAPASTTPSGSPALQTSEAPPPVAAPAQDTTAAPADAAPSVPLPAPRPAELAMLNPAPSNPAPSSPAAPASPPPAAQPAPAPAATQPGTNFVPPSAPATTQANPKPGQPIQLQPQPGAAAPTTQQAAAPATATQPAAATQTTTFPAGSYVVQVAATRTEQDARSAAASISQRYAQALSGFTPAVERADLGDRGIYYRVGVGPMNNQGQAASMCEKLKSAGLDCFVRRN